MKSDTDYGRTYADTISEKSWMIFIIVMAILLIILFFVSKNVPVKIWGIEIGKTNIHIHDTIIRHDTFFLQQNNHTLNGNKSTIKIQSFNQKGGQTANEISNY